MYSLPAPACTGTLSDVDYSVSTLNAGGWNNQATAWRDYTPCDVKFYTSQSFVGTVSSWQNSGGALAQFSSTFDRNVESFQLS